LSTVDERGLNPEVPVIIIGAGPVGLALAADMGWRGVGTLLVDQGTGALPQPKTSGVNIRTMEFCRRWGLRDRIRRGGLAKDYPRDHVWVTALTGHEIARRKAPSLKDDVPCRGAIETFMRIYQTEFDPILRDYVLSAPSVTTRYNTRCTKVEQDTDGVVATLIDVMSGETSQARARYLVSCEGAGSLIRRDLGIELLGDWVVNHSTNAYFRSSELLDIHDKGRAFMYSVINQEGYLGYFLALNGTDLWVAQIRGLHGQKPTASHDEVAETIRRFAGRDFDFELLDVMPWTRRRLVAEHYRKGRVFLAGDAIHQMPPSATLGMNTGMADATNLSWKLDAVLSGWGGASLLDTYETERRPVAERNATASVRVFRSDQIDAFPSPGLLEETPEGERARADLGARFLQSDAGMPTEGLQIGYRYEGSVICWPEESSDQMDAGAYAYVPTTRAGARAPDAWLRDGDPILDHFGRGFVLVCLGADPPDAGPFEAAAAARQVPLTVLDVRNREIEELYERRLVLVRPDGHVAWRGDDIPTDPQSVIDVIRGARTSEVARATASLGGRTQ
jgi:2-polyprenyl-6-methoxyphenol hydroxylase-like FAD-dependent oxidoreductase